jgi:hypothetical protein
LQTVFCQSLPNPLEAIGFLFHATPQRCHDFIPPFNKKGGGFAVLKFFARIIAMYKSPYIPLFQRGRERVFCTACVPFRHASALGTVVQFLPAHDGQTSLVPVASLRRSVRKIRSIGDLSI